VHHTIINTGRLTRTKLMSLQYITTWHTYLQSWCRLLKW